MYIMQICLTGRKKSLLCLYCLCRCELNERQYCYSLELYMLYEYGTVDLFVNRVVYSKYTRVLYAI